MSETKCKWCQLPKESHEDPRQFEAEPVIEVAPGEYERCAVAMFGCDSCGFKGYITFEEIAKHRARCAVPVLNHCPGCDEYGASHTTPSIEHPAVPAQEAPRESTCGQCGHLESRHRLGWPPEACLGATSTDMCLCQKFHPASPAEPQAGAQVPSQGVVRNRSTAKGREFWDHVEGVMDRKSIQGQLADEFGAMGKESYSEWLIDKAADLTAHLNTIKSYATEAAKTPITREDMHDPLKAQTFFDEAKGFERLVLSEIGGGK